MTAPRLSVVVPVYNAAATLDRCVESILQQTVPGGLELILVDDGSKDDSPALCDAWAERDARVRVIHQPNSGPSAARNAGLDAARGAYISFVDSDDRLLPDTCAVFLPRMEAEGLDLLVFGLERASGYDEPVPDLTVPDFAALADRLEYLLVDTGILASPVNKLYRAACLNAAPPVRFDARLAINEDLLFHLQLLPRCGRMALCSRPGYWVDDRGENSLSRQGRTDLLAAEEYTRPAFAAVLDAARLSGPEKQHLLQARRVSVYTIQFWLLAGRPCAAGTLRVAGLVRRILRYAPARRALLARLRTDPNRLAAGLLRLCVTLRLALPLAVLFRLRHPG